MTRKHSSLSFRFRGFFIILSYVNSALNPVFYSILPETRRKILLKTLLCRENGLEDRALVLVTAVTNQKGAKNGCPPAKKPVAGTPSVASMLNGSAPPSKNKTPKVKFDDAVEETAVKNRIEMNEGSSQNVEADIEHNFE